MNLYLSKFSSWLSSFKAPRSAVYIVPPLFFLVALFLSVTHYKLEDKSSIDNIQTSNPSNYVFQKTQPIFVGGDAIPTSAFIDLKLRFRVVNDASGHPNLFQTSPYNSGLRMEFTNNTASLLIPDKTIPGGLKGIQISSNLKTGKWYYLEIEALNSSHIAVYLDGESIEFYKSSGINFSLAKIIIGEGFSPDRKFKGDINDIYITYGHKNEKKSSKAFFIISTLLAVTIFFWLSSFVANKFKLSSELIGLWCSFIPVALYNSFTFSRYFPITEGWFSAYSHLIQNGSVPYRDFYLFIPPLYPLGLAAFQTIFGEDFILLRILGVIVSILTTGLLYLILARRFSVVSASFIATMTSIYIESGVAYIGYDFMYFFILFELISLYLLLRYSEKKVDTSEIYRIIPSTLFLSGLFLSLAFLIKQSNGALVGLFGCIAVGISVLYKPPQYRIKHLLVFICGAIIPFLLIGIWLYFVGAFKPFIDQVIFGAIGAKGTLSGIFFGWIRRNASKETLIEMLIILLILGFSLDYINIKANTLKRYFGSKVSAKQSMTDTKIYFWALCFCGSIIFIFGENKYLIKLALWMVPWYSDYKFFIKLAFLGCAFFITRTIYEFIKFHKFDITFIIIFLFGIGFLFGNGTSADIGECGTFLIIAMCLGYLANLPKISWITKPIVGAVCLSFSITLVINKFERPYYWWGLPSPSIWSSTSQSSLPLLSGMNLSPPSIKLMEEVVKAIQDRSSPADEVLTFPNIPLFYLLSERWPNSKAIVAWFDFLPDNLAIAEADRIKLSPPKVIVNLKLPEWVWRAHELAFRKGILGQRQIASAISSLINEWGYKLAYSKQIVGGPMIEVWYRE
jgi:hypothetical protein